MSYVSAENWYKSVPVGLPGEQDVPVPGWGMSPRLANGRMIAVGALGYDIPIKTQIGTTKVSIPLEKMAQDAGSAAVKAALPEFNAYVDDKVPEILNKAQLRMHTELDYALGRGAKIGAGIGALLVGSIWASAWWVRRGRR